MLLYEKNRNGLTIRLSGELDHSTASAIRAEIDELIDRFNVRKLIFDLSELDFMDSSGIGLIIGRYKRMARKGGSVERKARDISIFELERLGMEEQDHILRVRCSKGTYIRTLCNDIGEDLGCGGCMSSLRRTAAGVFSIEQANSMEKVMEMAGEGRAEELLLPVECLFADKARVCLSAAQEKKMRNGVRFDAELPDGTYRAFSSGGEFIALAESVGGELRAIKSFYEV